MKVLFCGKTEVSMKELLPIIKHRLGKSLTIDESKLPLNHPLAFLTTLTDFKGVSCNYGNLGSLLRHEQYTYLLYCSEREMTEILMESNLSITTNPDNEFAIISDNLQRWLMAIIAGCSDSALVSFRAFTNQILVDMEQRGLSQLFSSYRKSTLKDNTFKLLEKK